MANTAARRRGFIGFGGHNPNKLSVMHPMLGTNSWKPINRRPELASDPKTHT
jgi:hypothetical protein